MKKNNLWKTWIAVVALISAAAVGGILAYFTDTDEKVNEFVVGKVEIDLREPQWDKKPDGNQNNIPDEAEHMRPLQMITKDPQVTNTGNNDAFIFLTVQIPCREIVTVNEDGTRNPLALTELYFYQADPAWTCLGSSPVETEGKVTATKYLYAYAGEGQDCTIVTPNETTKPLFEQVGFVNAMEGQGLPDGIFDMEIHAYGIQTTDVNQGRKDPEGIWQVITNQKELLETYRQ